MSAIITDQLRILNAKSFVAAATSTANSFYSFIGLPNATDYSPTWDVNPPAPKDSFEQENDCWDTIIALKKITDSDVRQVVRKNVWSSGTTYDMYRHDISRTNTSKPSGATSLYSANYYVLNSDYRVYICLQNGTDPDNPEGRPSLDEPTFTDLEPRSAGTSNDGYIWKYLYTIKPSELVKFDSTNFIPVPRDWETSSDNSEVRTHASATDQIKIVTITNRGVGLGTANRTYTGVPVKGDGSGAEVTIVVGNDSKVSSVSVSKGGTGYSYGSSGIGTEATIDIIVGQGSSVIDFEIKNLGYGYGQGQILTVRSGGSTGIPTNTAYAFEEFKILIDKTYEDSFSAWTVGDLEVLDDISDLFDGVQRAFPIKFNDEFKTIRAKKGSNIDIKATLLIFLNDILQVPGQAYRFDTGSIIEFSEAPKNGDTCKIIFYKGTGSVDVINADILETIKKGDDITLNSDNYSYQEEERTVNLVVSSDIVKTNAYGGVGISTDETFAKAITWCRQTEDKFINGKPVAKDRTSYEPLIQPLSNIISDIGISTNAIYVESVKTFFDSSKENIQIGVILAAP